MAILSINQPNISLYPQTFNHSPLSTTTSFPLDGDIAVGLCAELCSVLDQHTCNSRRCQGRENTRDQSGESNLCDTSTTTWSSKLGDDTDLHGNRGDVAKTAKRVCGNEVGSWRQGCLGLWGNELSEGNELVSNNLDTNELADDEEIILPNTQEPCDWVEEVAEDELDGQVVWIDQVVWWLWRTETGSNVDVLAKPGENAVNHGEHGENNEEGGGNHTSHLKTEPSTHSEGVEGVLWLLLRLVALRDNHAAGGEGLLSFWVAELRDGEGGWNRHDAGRDQSLWVDTHTDVGGEDGTGNGSKTRGHDLVDFGIGQVRNERLDKHDRLSLSDERRGSSDDGLSS